MSRNPTTRFGNQSQATFSSTLVHFAQTINRYLKSTHAKNKPVTDNTELFDLLEKNTFDFSNPQSFREFIESPAGQKIKALISTNEHAKQLSQKMQHSMYQELLHQEFRFKIFLIKRILMRLHALGILQNINEELNSKMLIHAKNNTLLTAGSKNKPSFEGIEELLEECDKTLHYYQNEIDFIDQRDKDLELIITNLLEQQHELTYKHHEYTMSLAELETKIEHLESLSIEHLEHYITQLENQLHLQTQQVIDLLDKGDTQSEKDARSLLNKQNALNLQLANLYDLHSYKTDAKTFYNTHGQVVNTLSEANFVLNKGLKIVIKDNAHYLLSDHQDFDQISQQDKTDALERYNRSKHELSTVNVSVKNTMILETGFFKQRIKEAQDEKEGNQSEKKELQHKIVLIQSVRATLLEVNSDLEQINAREQQLNLTPKFTPSVTKSPDKSEHANLVIQAIHTASAKNKQIHSKYIYNTIEHMYPSATLQNQLKDLLKEELQKLNIAIIPSTTPIPHTTMRSLLENLARFGGNPYNPAVSPIPSPVNSAKPKKEESYAPSPFNMRPLPK